MNKIIAKKSRLRCLHLFWEYELFLLVKNVVMIIFIILIFITSFLVEGGVSVYHPILIFRAQTWYAVETMPLN